MRSLLSPEPAEAPSAPEAIRPAPSVEPDESPNARPDGPAPGDLNRKLFMVTERLAVALMERAEKDLLQEKGDGAASVRELQQAVQFAMDLLVKLPKLKPEDEDNDDAGVGVLRAMLQDPVSVVDRLIANPKFIAAMKAKNWLPPPARPSHRPTNAQQAERAEYEARRREQERPGEDDSELQRMLKRGQTNGTEG